MPSFSDFFPDDVTHLIMLHKAAMTVQRVWRKHSLFSHARDVRWDSVRSHLESHGALQTLWRFSNVRREWRHELDSWMNVSSDTIAIIVQETTEHLWGHEVRLEC